MHLEIYYISLYLRFDYNVMRGAFLCLANNKILLATR